MTESPLPAPVEPDIRHEINRLHEVTEERARTGTRLDVLAGAVADLRSEFVQLRTAHDAQSKALTEALAGLTATLSGLNTTVGQLGEQVQAMRVAAEKDLALQRERIDLERSAPERWRSYGLTVAEVAKSAVAVLGILGAGAAAVWAAFGGRHGQG